MTFAQINPTYYNQCLNFCFVPLRCFAALISFYKTPPQVVTDNPQPLMVNFAFKILTLLCVFGRCCKYTLYEIKLSSFFLPATLL